eukprot:14594499-Alexandrium_andersonii.AAC.1
MESESACRRAPDPTRPSGARSAAHLCRTTQALHEGASRAQSLEESSAARPPRALSASKEAP